MTSWWTYESPTEPFAPITGHLSFYAQRVECSVAGERVAANEGDYYGG